jgi:hypothetical protein
LANGLEEPKVRGRHLAIDEDSEGEILEWIEAQAEKCKSVTRTDIQHYCEAKYSCLVNRGWIDSFILRHRDDFKQTKSIPQEDTRSEAPRAFLDKTICCL